mmetsp:Transcript_22227/g.40836  ORF Transcript_22227/g.40836 Transcript_22227/m.40836 type:complete len:457 (-) Transcript_22227:380-1750(-)
MLPTEVSTESHAGSNGVAMKHTSGELVTWRPCVSKGMRSALVSLPEVTKFGLHVGFHCQANHTATVIVELFPVAQGLELGFVESRKVRSKLGLYEVRGAHLLQEFKELLAFHTRHLDNLGNSVANHSWMHSRPEGAVGKRHNGRMEGSEGVLVSLSIAAGSGRGAGVDSGHDGGRENHIWSVSVEKGARESRNVSDNTTADNQYRLVPHDAQLLELEQDLLHALDVLVDLVSAPREDVAGDAMEVKVPLHLLADGESPHIALLLVAIVDAAVRVEIHRPQRVCGVIELVVQDNDSAAQRPVDLRQVVVVEAQDVAADANARAQGGRHDRLDLVGALGGHRAAVRLAVDGGRVDCVRFHLLELLELGQVLGPLGGGGGAEQDVLPHCVLELQVHHVDGADSRGGVHVVVHAGVIFGQHNSKFVSAIFVSVRHRKLGQQVQRFANLEVHVELELLENV